MKALSVRQPFATLLVTGAKQYETRTWVTDHRGPLIIHAANGKEDWQLETYGNPTVKKVVRQIGYDRFYDLPFGRLLGVVEVKRIYKTEALSRSELSDFEQRVGNFRRGRYAWHMAPQRQFQDPPQARGHPGIWTPEDKVLPN